MHGSSAHGGGDAFGKFLPFLLGVREMNNYFYMSPLPGDKVGCIPAKRFAHNEVVIGSLSQSTLFNVFIY